LTHLRRKVPVIASLALVACLSGQLAALVAAQSDRPVKRARPPKWSADVLDAFFGDARERLVGERPEYSTEQAPSQLAAEASNAAAAAEAAAPGTAWSKLIDADTIETEIKRLAQTIDCDVTTPSEFKGGKYQDCRRHFSVLAMLFAVAAEHDPEVRWHDASPGLRDLFARAGYNCKVGTDQTYQEANQRKQDLAELVRGSRSGAASAEREADWSQVADRPPLMQRLNIAHEERLTKWLATEREFARHADDVRHEAQLAAAIADVIGREGFDYWDDEQYAAYAHALRAAASDVAAAVKLDDFEQARRAVSRMTKACADCHEGYRG